MEKLMSITYNNEFILCLTKRVYLVVEKFPQLCLSSVGQDVQDTTEYKMVPNSLIILKGLRLLCPTISKLLYL